MALYSDRFMPLPFHPLAESQQVLPCGFVTAHLSFLLAPRKDNTDLPLLILYCSKPCVSSFLNTAGQVYHNAQNRSVHLQPNPHSGPGCINPNRWVELAHPNRSEDRKGWLLDLAMSSGRTLRGSHLYGPDVTGAPQLVDSEAQAAAAAQG